jgi:hypothetical protein
LVKPWTLGSVTAGIVGEYFFAPGGLQLIDLEIEEPSRGTDSGISY